MRSLRRLVSTLGIVLFFASFWCHAGEYDLVVTTQSGAVFHVGDQGASREALVAVGNLPEAERELFLLRREELLTSLAEALDGKKKHLRWLNFLRRSALQRWSSEPLLPATIENKLSTEERGHLVIEAMLLGADHLLWSGHDHVINMNGARGWIAPLGGIVAAGTPRIETSWIHIPKMALGLGISLGCEWTRRTDQDRCHLDSLYIDVDIVNEAVLPSLLAAANLRVARGVGVVGEEGERLPLVESMKTTFLPVGPIIVEGERMMGGGAAIGLSTPPVIAWAAYFKAKTLRFRLPLKPKQKVEVVDRTCARYLEHRAPYEDIQ